ncbi:MAG TPA: VOC family protein [Acidimicrobiales bacterium]|nr:VOC family protein [Acidimicrobiales bacterium]
MTVMTSYPPGVPSWIDLATPDPEAAKSFYGALFGWEYSEEATDQPGVHYVMATKDGHSAAGMMLLSEEMAASGMPPVWSSYVTVTDVEATVAEVAPAGGTVLQPAMDVMEAGRMAVVADPAGAVICLWQAKEHIGAEVVNEHGALTWNELITPDPAAVAPFYAALFGWTTEAVPMEGDEYTLFRVDGGNEGGIAGAMAPPMPGMPAFWGVYFNVDDVGATVELAKGLGAQVLMDTTVMPGVGTLAALTDPQGAVFSLMTPEA